MTEKLSEQEWQIVELKEPLKEGKADGKVYDGSSCSTRCIVKSKACGGN